ncbi:AsmA family protein [Mesorhizobium sp. NBSH29]|nr:AsmA family protein [Mesorhizobium sp. NBSH29]
MARVFVIVGGLLVLVLSAALVGPHFVDWTSYRAQFERESSALLGRRVTVEGGVTARLLPFPSLTFSDVVVDGASESEPSVTAETFSMDAELAPFLRGEVLIFDMRLVRPRVVVNIAEDGTVDWTTRPSSPFSASQISLEKLTITEGAVVLTDGASKRVFELNDVNAVASARSFAGPWRADGTLNADGIRTAVSIATGKPGDDGKLRLKLKLDPLSLPVSIEADGDLSLDENRGMVYGGTFRLAAGDNGDTRLRSSDGETFRVAEDGRTRTNVAPNRMSGTFAIDHTRLAVEEFRFETGPLDDPYTAEGRAFIDIGAEPRFSIEANGAQVRFADVQDQNNGLRLGVRMAALQALLANVPRPAIPGTVSVNLPALVAGDTTIRDITLSAEPTPQGWKVASIAATLPGRTRLEGEGLLSTGDAFGFTGSLLLAVAQPSGFAAWLTPDVDEAIRRMPAAGFRAQVALTPERQRFSDLELVLGQAKFRGEIDSQQPRDALPFLRARLEGGALDVDGLAAMAALFISEKGANRLAGRDFDLDLKAGPISAFGLTAESIDTALRMRQGTLEIDRLSVGGLEGATLNVTASVKGFPQNPEGNADVSVLAADLAPLLAVVADRYPDSFVAPALAQRAAMYPGLFEDTRLKVVASVASNGDGTHGVALSASGNTGGSVVTLTASGNGLPSAPGKAKVSLSYSATNNNAEALLALYGIPALPLGMIGSGEMTVSAMGTPRGGMETTATLNGADMKADFSGTVTASNTAVTATGPVNIKAADIEPWLMTAGVGLPGMGMGLPVALSATADFGRGSLVFSDLTGTVAGIEASGSITTEIKRDLPHLTGTLKLGALDFGAPVAMVLGSASLEGGDVWPKTPFQQRSSLPFTAEMDLEAASVLAGPFGDAANAHGKLRLDLEGLRVSELSAEFAGGVVGGFGELKNTNGTGLLSAQLKLDGVDVGQLLPQTGLAARATITSVVSASGKSVEGMVAALSGSGTVSTERLVIARVNPDAITPLLAAADAAGREIDADRTADFAPEIILSGEFDTGRADLAFTIAGGVLRAPPLVLRSRDATLNANLRADFNLGAITADGTIAYDPGDEKLVGSDPVVLFVVEGPTAELEKQLKTDPLAQFLTQRALEKEQARVEAMQAILLEKQRLRREVRYFAALEDARERAIAEANRKAEEEARRQADEEARFKAEEAAKKAAEAEALRKAADAAMAAKKAADAETAARKASEADAAKKAAEAFKRDEAERAQREAERVAPTPAPERAIPKPTDGAADKPSTPFLLDNILRSLTK